MTSQPLLFTLISPKELKDDIVDELMSMPQITGFNLQKIKGYSKEHSSFNITEQVEGYRELFQFEVLIDSTEKEALMLALQPICQRSQLRYWFITTVENGHF
tara:strand:+ start:118 stop:423 length:306 start_codon:yes stop_codon:yes gene_type:complete